MPFSKRGSFLRNLSKSYFLEVSGWYRLVAIALLFLFLFAHSSHSLPYTTSSGPLFSSSLPS
jgi:hypothetical protein